MIRYVLLVTLVFCLTGVLLEAQEAGSASGEGTIERFIAGSDKSEQVSFSPRYSHAYTEGTGAKKRTWIVFTEKEPPLKEWAKTKNRIEARRLWCEKEKASFVAVELNAEWGVELYYLCPANGKVNMEMLSTINGLASVVLNFEHRDTKRLKGTLSGGEGSCGDPNGKQVYCEPQENYTFDAPFLN